MRIIVAFAVLAACSPKAAEPDAGAEPRPAMQAPRAPVDGGPVKRITKGGLCVCHGAVIDCADYEACH